MSSFRFRRVASIVSAAALASMLLGVGTAVANPPHWVMDVQRLPPTVGANTNAGFRVTITNNGPSNITTLFLTSDQTANPSYVGPPTQGACNAAASGPLFCAFGTLTPTTHTASVTVAYAVGTANFGVIFMGSTTGNTGSDGGASHGDFLYTLPDHTTHVTISNSQNFGGGFSITTGLVANGGLGGGNTQQTSVKPPKSAIIATVEDGLADTTFSCSSQTECGNRFGQWSRVNVDNGHNFSSDTPKAFSVTLKLSGGIVPSGATTSTIDVIHVLDDGTAYTISTRCDSTTPIPGNVECLIVTKSGNVYTIVVWLFQNGGLHGTF